MLRKSILKLDDFSGGLITKGSELTIAKNQTSDCVNVYSDLFKALQKRQGYNKLNKSAAPTAYADSANHAGVNTLVTSASHGLADGDKVVITGTTGAAYDGVYVIEHVVAGAFEIIKAFGTNPAAKGTWTQSSNGAAKGLYNFRQSDTVQYLISLWATGLKKMDVVSNAWDGIWDSISVSATHGTALSANFMYNTTYENDCIITTEGRDVPQKYNPSVDANYIDLDWETSHCYVVGNVSVVTPNPLIAVSALKVTIERKVFDNIIMTGDTSIADCVASINAATSNARILGDQTTYTATLNDKIKVTVDSTVYDNINIGGAANLAAVPALINAVIAAKGTATIVGGYLEIISLTNGAASNVTIADGGTTAQTVIAKLFSVVAQRTDTGNVPFATHGFAVVDASGYLRIYSNVRGSTGSVVVADGTTDDKETTEILFLGTSNTGTTITSNIAPQGKFCHTWQFYTWIANTAANPDRIYFSGADDPTSWSALDYQDLITPGDIGITGLVTLGESTYVFKKNSIHRISYLGGLPLFKYVQASQIGTASPRSIQVVEIPGQRTSIIFLGTDLQIYRFDGYNATPLSESISTYNGISTYCTIGDASTYGINFQQLNLVHAVNYTYRHWYVMYFCKGNETAPKDAIIFDYYGNSFWPVHLDQDGSDVFNVSCIADNGYGQLKEYVGGTDGTNYYAWLCDAGNSDDGGNIDAYWTSPRLDLGSEIQAKGLRLVHFTMKSVACTPYYSYRTDWNSSWSDVETLAASTIEHVYDMPRFEELVQLKLQDDSTSAAFNLMRSSIVATVRGEAK